MAINKNFNRASVLQQLTIVQSSIDRAKIPFEIDIFADPVMEVTLYELIKSYKQIENIIREIDDRFSTVTVPAPITLDVLNICENCGDPDCTSDHK